MTDAVERQRSQLALDPGGDQGGVDTGRQQVRLAAIGQRPCQVIEDKLDDYSWVKGRISPSIWPKHSCGQADQ